MSRTAEIRALAPHDPARAEALLSELLTRLFDLRIKGLRINFDQYSLNSLNGFFSCDLGDCFFKFHQEEGEELMRGEYYRAGILSDAGLPVDRPLLTSTLPGEQILVYRRRQEQRFSDVLRELDLAPDPAAEARALAAEARLNERLLEVARATLHPISPSQSRAEPIHRLFHQRLIDPVTGSFPGGRLSSFYVGKEFSLPGLTLPWEALAHSKLRLNGEEYSHTLADLFAEAHARLEPGLLADAGGITAHGDAHNANVWYRRGEAQDALSLFDPAFAGADVPSLLAEVKSTFHNCFAHPLWLYDSDHVPGRWQVTARMAGNVLEIDSDWHPGSLREALLAVKARSFWKPWLKTLQLHGLLPQDWERVIRLALFLCPTLVMNLRAGAPGGRHNPESSALGLMVAASCGSPSVTGDDLISRFIASIRPV